MITYVQGDLLKSDCDVIAHGCNCFRTWGAGIARQMRSEYPEAFEADWRSTHGEEEKLGTFTYAQLPHRAIFNLYTQHRYGIDRVHVDYEAVATSLDAMKSFLQMYAEYDDLKIGLPQIGCGLAGGSWDTISQIIEEVFGDKEIFVYILDAGEVERARVAGSRIEQAIQEMKSDPLSD